jgi:hypothetical protein
MSNFLAQVETAKTRFVNQDDHSIKDYSNVPVKESDLLPFLIMPGPETDFSQYAKARGFKLLTLGAYAGKTGAGSPASIESLTTHKLYTSDHTPIDDLKNVSFVKHAYFHF